MEQRWEKVKKKIHSGTMLMLLLTSMPMLAFNIKPVKSGPTTIIVPDDYPTVQEAIDNSSEGDTVFVRNGTYYENLVVGRNDLTLIGENSSNTVIDGNNTGNVVVITASNVQIAGFTVQHSGYRNCGVNIVSSGNDIANTIVINNYCGIKILSSSENDISSNNITDNHSSIILSGADNNGISGNHVDGDSWRGIHIYNSSHNTIAGNVIRNNKDSIGAICLEDSFDNTFSDNVLNDNLAALCVDGSRLRHFMHSIDVSNTINGKPVYYLVNQTDLLIDSASHPQVGYLALINCANVTVEELTLSNNGQGLLLAHTSNSSVTNNLIADNFFGVDLRSVSNSTVYRNNFRDNDIGVCARNGAIHHVGICGNNITGGGAAVFLDGCQNTVCGNNVTNYGSYGMLMTVCHTIISGNSLKGGIIGIALSGTSNIISGNSVTAGAGGLFMNGAHSNTISENNIIGESRGMCMIHSNDNRIFHNNFMNNSVHVEILFESCVNFWDDGYLSGGNYWSDYEERYPDATEIDDSGIWNTPYVIDEDNQDNYPLMEPWTPLPRTIDELKTEIEELGSDDEIDNLGIVRSLLAKLNVAQKLVDKRKIEEAISILEEDFIPQVQNLSGIHITPEAADILIQSAEYIMSHL